VATETRTVARSLGSLFRTGTTAGLTDGELLDRFATGAEEASEQAFLVLVERHGPRVLHACRRILRDEHEAQDAFQATFLILARKGRSIWVRDSLGPWLLRVARRVAVKARADAIRRAELNANFRETIAGHRRAGGDTELARDLREEIDRLEDRFRLPIVLCDLEGLTYDEAARRLGWSAATVKGRLARGRDHLRTQLAGRGFAVSCLSVHAAGPAESVRLVSPAALASATAQAAVQFRAARVISDGVISLSASTLAEGAMKAMFLTRIKAVFLAGFLVTGGAVVLGQQSANRSPRLPSATLIASATPAVDHPVDGDQGHAEDLDVVRDLNQIDMELLTDELKGLREDLKRFSRMKWDAERLDAEDPARPMRLKDAQAFYKRARAAYVARARELRDVRKQLVETGSVSEDLAGPRPGEVQRSSQTETGVAEKQPLTASAAIGSVDMDAVFRRYSKVKRVSEGFKEQAKDAPKERYNPLLEEVQKLKDQLAKLAPGTQEHSTLEGRFTAMKERLEVERSMLERDFADREAQNMSEIYGEIQAAIARAAKRKGLSHVVRITRDLPSPTDPNKLTKLLNGSILFADPRNDLTDEVIHDLNREDEVARQPKS